MIHKHLLVSLGPRGKVPILRLCLHSESSCNHNTKGDCCQLSVSPGLSGLLLLYSQGPSLQNVCLLRMWGKIRGKNTLKLQLYQMFCVSPLSFHPWVPQLWKVVVRGKPSECRPQNSLILTTS